MSSEPILPLTPGDFRRVLYHESRERSYLIHVPAGYDGSRPWPVVLAFHGGATDAAAMIRFCDLNQKADEAGFIAVYPNGTGRREHLFTWNAGTCCGYAMWNNVDDVGFVGQIIDQLTREANIDPRRVYATGMSNGAMMAYRLASELADRIAAVAAIAGPMASDACNPSRPVPILHFHGTADESAPFEGGIGRRSLTKVVKESIPATIDRWRKANGCDAPPTTERLPMLFDDNMPVVKMTYGPGRAGSEVILYVVENGGHTWPGNPPRLTFLGPCTQNISANDLLWDFFVKHPMPRE